MATEKLEINSKILIWARSQIGIAGAELAKLALISPSKLLAFEVGKDSPTWSELKRIAKALNRPTSIFFFSSAPEGQQKPTDFRLLPTNQSQQIPHELLTQLRLLEFKREMFVELSSSLNAPFSPFKLRAELSDDPEDRARIFRSQNTRLEEIIVEVGDKTKAFNKWRTFIESLGVLTFQVSGFELNVFRGVALYFPQVPVIAINAKDAPAGKIFSLLHELYHLMLNVSGISNNATPDDEESSSKQIEYKANRFAGAVIAPSSRILEYFKGLSSAQILDSKTLRLASRRLKVSEDVIARRLHDLGYIGREKYQVWYDARTAAFVDKESRKKLKQKASEGGPAPAVIARAYQSPLFLNKIGDGISARVIHKAEAASALGLTINSLDKVMSGNS